MSSQRVPNNVVSNIILLNSQISDRNILLDLFNNRVGTLECLNIIKSHFPIDELNRRIADLEARFNSNQLVNMPLMQIDGMNNEVYMIKLVRIDKLITGEYMTVEDLERKLEDDKIISLRKDLNRLQDMLVENSMKVYASLTTSLKMTNFGRKFNGLMVSKKRRYLYYYTNDKKKTLGFIAERIQE